MNCQLKQIVQYFKNWRHEQLVIVQRQKPTPRYGELPPLGSFLSLTLLCSFLIGQLSPILYIVKQTSSSTSIELIWSINLSCPALCCDINEKKILFAGLTNGFVMAIKLEENTVSALGTHDAPICGVFWIKNQGYLMSFGFDCFVKCWSLTGRGECRLKISLASQTLNVSFDLPYLLICSVQNTISIVNVYRLSESKFPVCKDDYKKVDIENAGKILCSKIKADGKKIALGTTDGRFAAIQFQEISKTIHIVNTVTNQIPIYSKINCIDIAPRTFDYTVIGGSQDLSAFNIMRNFKGETITKKTPTIGAVTAVRLHLSHDFMFILYATGTDQENGMNECYKKQPRIEVVRLHIDDLKNYSVSLWQQP